MSLRLLKSSLTHLEIQLFVKFQFYCLKVDRREYSTLGIPKPPARRSRRSVSERVGGGHSLQARPQGLLQEGRPIEEGVRHTRHPLLVDENTRPGRVPRLERAGGVLQKQKVAYWI